MTIFQSAPGIGAFIAAQANRFSRPKKRVLTAPLLGRPVRFPYGSFQFQITSSPGEPIEIQTTTNLTTWRTLHCGKAESGPMDYVDPNAKNLNACFYRIFSAGMSGNVIGYVTLSLPPGYSLLSNPLRAASSTVQALFPGMPDGTSLHKFDAAGCQLRANLVKSRWWADPNQTLLPGEAGLFFNPTSDYKALSFVGEVPKGHQYSPVPTGFSLRASMLPIRGRLDTDLLFPMEEGDVFHVFDSNKQQYHTSQYAAKTWEKDPLVLAVGEGFWVGKVTARNWIQSFDP